MPNKHTYTKKSYENQDLSIEQLNEYIKAHTLLLDKMKALDAVIPDCPPEVLMQHTAEIFTQEVECREMNLDHLASDGYETQPDSDKLYRRLFTIMQAIERLNFRISKIMKATMLVTKEELKNLKKTMPGIAGYAHIQHTVPVPAMRQHA